MPAATKSRGSKHDRKPYARQVKDSSHIKDAGDGEVLARIATSTSLVENTAKRLYQLVSWAFSSSEGSLKSVSESASKILHREQPKRSATSQLEDGLLHSSKADRDSLLAPDLVPHYLGKTPNAVKSRRQPPAATVVPSFRVPSFDSSQFKIPVLPSPSAGKLHQASATPTSEAEPMRPPPRGKGMKSLEIGAETQSRHDEDILEWLAAQNLTPHDLASGHIPKTSKVDDKTKLDRVLADGEFFRRQGIFPPVSSQPSNGMLQARSEKSLRRSHSRSSMEGGRKNAGQVTEGRRLTSRDWQISSSTGILAAWRDMCEQQENRAQSISLNVPHNTRARSTSIASSIQDPTLWHDNISFSKPSKDVPDNLRSVPEPDVDLAQAGERYWAPIRSYPLSDVAAQRETRDDQAQKVAQHFNGRVSTRRHSRQASVARKSLSRRGSESLPKQSELNRPTTPTSVASSRPGRSRRPVNASRDASRSRQRSERPPEPVKPQMVDSQVQTSDELMLFMQDEPKYIAPAIPTISKERRKRPGCFSALDEDLEEVFGPYDEQPTKKLRLNDAEDEVAFRPRIPILREDDAVKKLRAQRQNENVAISSQDDKTQTASPELNGTPAAAIRSPTPQNTVVLPSMTFGTTTASAPSEIPKTQASGPSIFDKKAGDLNSVAAPDQETSPVKKDMEHGGLQSEKRPQTGASADGTRPQQKAFSLDFNHSPASTQGPDPSISSTNQALPFSVPTSKGKEGEAGAVPKKNVFNFNSNAQADNLTNMQPAKPAIFSFAPPKESSAAQTATPKFSGFGNSSSQSKEDNSSKLNSFSNGSLFKSSGEGSVTGVIAGQGPQVKDALSEPQQNQSLSVTDSAGPQKPFSFGKSSSSAPPLNFGTPRQEASSDVSGSKTDGNTTAEKMGNSNPAKFTFGTPSQTSSIGSNKGSSDGPSNTTDAPTQSASAKDEKAASFSFPNNAKSESTSNLGITQAKPNFGHSTPSAGSGVSSPGGGAVMSPSFSFGTPQQTAGSTNNPFGGPPAQTPSTTTAPFSNGGSIFGSAQPTANNNKPSFGTSQPNTGNAFGSFGAAQPATTNDGNAASSLSSFGSATQPATSTFSPFQPPQTNTNASSSMQSNSQSTFSFGNNFGNNSNNTTASAPAANSGFTFGQPSTQAASAPASFTFGSQQPATNTAPAFQFGTAASNAAPAAFGSMTQNNSSQGFGFGQAQTAPNSGFASPALQSPAIQSATAPGSPSTSTNPFDFASGASSSGSRKIAQPKTRRKR